MGKFGVGSNIPASPGFISICRRCSAISVERCPIETMVVHCILLEKLQRLFQQPFGFWTGVLLRTETATAPPLTTGKGSTKANTSFFTSLPVSRTVVVC